MAGLGVVIRDSDSKTMDTTIQQTQLGADVKYAEVEVVNWVLQVAKNTNFQIETIEADWQNVASLVNNRQSSKSEILWIISKFQCYM